jgi:DNA polymerase-3 subunit delta
MSNTIHAFDFLQSPQVNATTLIPVFGSDRFLRSLVIHQLVASLAPDADSDFAASYFDGDSVQWFEINDELSTASLFSAGMRIVVVNDADNFVKNHREHLEKIAKEKASSAPDRALILCVNSWATNTKLYKQCDKNSLQIEVNSPQQKRGRNKFRDDAKIIDWIIERGKSNYEIKLTKPAARQMLDLIDDDFGRIDQELVKISLLVPAGKNVSPDQVVEIVGGWKAKSIWQAVDLATDGETGEALVLLDRLLQSGDHPLALYGQLAWSLRRYVTANEIFQRHKRNDTPVSLHEALKQAGFRNWDGELDAADQRMKSMGRERIAKLCQWLLETDLALKGTHSNSTRGRFALEMLFAKLATRTQQKANAI